MSNLTLEEAIKVLRQHNEKGASVLRITKGQVLEKELLAQVLNSCEQLISENAEYKRLLKLAVEDFNKSLGAMYTCPYCKYIKRKREVCESRKEQYCGDICEWRYADEALKLIGEGGDAEWTNREFKENFTKCLQL